MDSSAFDFIVRKDDLRVTEFRSIPEPDDVSLADGEVLLSVDQFGFTANNITYAVFGDMMQYWSFFPAASGWGRVPVWGFAVVAKSRHPKIAVGERIYGYLPMSSYFVAKAGQVNAAGFSDISEHRRERDAFYNLYQRTAADPGYDPRREAEQMLLRPLFFTGFLIDDFLAENAFYGARSVVISSASSKTSICLASRLHKRGKEACEVVGLTSPANVEFVRELACHHRVVAYTDIESLDATAPTVFVDMAGDGDVTMRIHRHFSEGLRYHCQVGGTHWERMGAAAALPGPAPELFWAPGRLAKRLEDWGASGFQERTGKAWVDFLASVGGWMKQESASGKDALRRVYLDALEGRANPAKGYVVSPRT
jgi:hypothetical protein